MITLAEYGSEDIALLPNGLAFISSGLKYPGIVSFAPERPGEIFLLDLNDEELRPSTLRISKGFDLSTFSPHGISAYIDEEDVEDAPLSVMIPMAGDH
ncbi:unnamed protein product [Ranitomeya imitator]|uniref:Paraoxonase n=1 Tax=Ranitomeya imitator TaxID=111125 RepID=A0ABN9MEH9_9NEOB|nr:unnamed protein product [Ranitomeya imitator]